MPGGRESTGMIESNQIDMRQERAHTVNPPSVPAPSMGFPVVDGVAPELALGIEIVRRDAANKSRPSLLVQLEQLRIGPHVAGVRGDEKGQVADQAHAVLVRVVLQSFSLAEQEELRQANLIDFVREVAPRLI